MTGQEFDTLCNARNALCNFCEVYECEKCIVTRLIDDAYTIYQEGYSFMNSLESLISGSDSVEEAGLLCIAKTISSLKK